MKKELKRLDVLQTGKVLGVLYAFIAAIILPFMLIGMLLNPKGGGGAALTLILVVLYPLLGFIGGILMASFYNLTAKWVGGIRFTLEESE